MQINRRSFVKVGLSGVGAVALGSMVRSPFLMKALHAAGGNPNKKLLLIFMRGGNDGVNTCIPYGDVEYNDANRPTIFIPEANALDLGNGYAAFHPSLTALKEVHDEGDLATIHRVAYENQSRSHFDSQHYWENAKPGDGELEEGWLYRHVIETMDPIANPIVASSISDQLMLTLKGETVLPHIPDVATYGFGNLGEAAADKLLGSSPNGGDLGSGILGWYGRPASPIGYDLLVKNTGLSLGASLIALENAGVDPDTYVPENGATYPNADAPEGFGANTFTFFRRLRDAAMLLKLTDMNIACVEIDGFDTHSNQGQANGAQAGLLEQVSHGIRSLRLDLLSLWNDVTVVTVSEFGRTSEENGSNGTDHGEASCLFVAGGAVKGGVYNCDATTWQDGDMFSTANGRYVAHLTDFRAVLAEILTDHFGVGASALDAIIPGYSENAGDPKFQPLGIL